MPFKRRADLPDPVKDHLPVHAQDICRKAFTSAWEPYANDEERAYAVAWAAVQKTYHKGEDGDWLEGANDDSD